MSLFSHFSKILSRGSLKKTNINDLRNVVRHSSLWEPDYLILGKTKTPEYDLVNLQIKGYDFVVLENFQKYIHKIAKVFEIDNENNWAAPQRDLKVCKFKPNSSTVEQEYSLKVYERNIQIADVKGHIMPLFIEAVVTACPPGVKISFHEHTQEMEDDRYIPDIEIMELQDQLASIEEGKKKKKKQS